jgi:hypothetical protein
MFYDDPQFVRGSDGRIYEVRDPNREGGIMFFFLFLFLGIVYAIYSAYLWLLQHYWVVSCLTLVGFITWTGWVYDDIQKNKTYDGVGKKIWAALMVLAGFVVAFNGFSAAIKGAQATNALQGEWFHPESGISMKIEDDQFTLNPPREQITIEAACKTEYEQSGYLQLQVNGQQFKGAKIAANSTPFAQTYRCRIVQDQLALDGNGGVLMFQRK